MQTLDEKQVARTWEQTSNLKPEAAREAMHDLARHYPSLLAFVLATTEDLGTAAQSLANVLFFQIARTFTENFDSELPQVSEEVLATLFEENLEALAADADEDEPSTADEPWRAGSGQPHLLRRVLEALFDAPVRPDGVEITEDEIGHLFVVLKTVVDALDDATSAATTPA
ncbi:MAG: hypothetical protein SX243_13905 [Acidobacteriota bacterium]|nr:hypothetical protein [Acidobacteriota bacterium]